MSIPLLVSVIVCIGLAAAPVSVGAEGGTTIRACVNKYSGRLRIVRNDDRCYKPERRLEWSVQGPPGISGYEIVTSTTNEAVAPGARFGWNAECPDPKVALGGGYALGDALNTSPELAVLESAPLINNEGFYDGKFWHVEVKNVGADPSFFTVYAVCGLTGP